MENRLKERLTGAAILVALVVIVVPELFRGGASSTRTRPAAPSSTTTAATHAFTIDLAAPVGPAPPISPAPQGAPAVVSPAVLPPVSAPAPAPAPAPAATHAKPAARAPAAHATAPAAHATAAPDDWAVQLGVFSHAANAQRLQRSARKHGFHARIERAGARRLYRVYIPGLADRAAAEQLSRRLHAQGFAVAVMHR